MQWYAWPLHAIGGGAPTRTLRAPGDLFRQKRLGATPRPGWVASLTEGGGGRVAMGPSPPPTPTAPAASPDVYAPEVLADRGYDGFTADIWSVGVILYVLLAGFLPFDEPSMSALFRKIIKAEFAYPSWFSPSSKGASPPAPPPAPRRRPTPRAAAAAARRRRRRARDRAAARPPVRPSDLLGKILVPAPEKRLAIAEIKSHEWFVEGGFTEEEEDPGMVNVDNDLDDDIFEEAEETEVKTNAVDGAQLNPQSMNAFELITLCGGLDLTPMFEKDSHAVKKFTRFYSHQAAPLILNSIGEILTEMDVNHKLYKNTFKVKINATTDKGQLTCTAQVFMQCFCCVEEKGTKSY